MTKKPYHYGSEPSQVGDFYQSNSTQPSPLVILIHGGYWKDNHDRDSYATRNLIKPLVTMGVSVWNLEYRRMEYKGKNITAAWPNLLCDVADGIDFVRELAEKENIDLERILLIGHSAGGHLATWAASRHNLPIKSEAYRSNPLIVKRMISIAGIMDFSIAAGECLEHIERLIGGDQATFPERFHAADPTRLQQGVNIPQLIIHGVADDCVAVEQARSYVKKPKNPKLRYIEWKDADHFSMLLEPGKKHWPAMIKILEDEISQL